MHGVGLILNAWHNYYFQAQAQSAPAVSSSSANCSASSTSSSSERTTRDNRNRPAASVATASAAVDGLTPAAAPGPAVHVQVQPRRQRPRLAARGARNQAADDGGAPNGIVEMNMQAFRQQQGRLAEECQVRLQASKESTSYFTCNKGKRNTGNLSLDQ